jgi:hypothetical protein
MPCARAGSRSPRTDPEVREALVRSCHGLPFHPHLVSRHVVAGIRGDLILRGVSDRESGHLGSPPPVQEPCRSRHGSFTLSGGLVAALSAGQPTPAPRAPPIRHRWISRNRARRRGRASLAPRHRSIQRQDAAAWHSRAGCTDRTRTSAPERQPALDLYRYIGQTPGPCPFLSPRAPPTHVPPSRHRWISRNRARRRGGASFAPMHRSIQRQDAAARHSRAACTDRTRTPAPERQPALDLYRCIGQTWKAVRRVLGSGAAAANPKQPIGTEGAPRADR